uniref:Uncharacterized protein n=1 Tax=Anguilla anguilla TaxID=7936 RepID=A0A0E9RHE2_ANGAN
MICSAIPLLLQHCCVPGLNTAISILYRFMILRGMTGSQDKEVGVYWQ